jgi:glycosyltransferase involved in cell wall biosynthesis
VGALNASTAPDLSVVIPTHDRAASLRRTLSGIERCTRSGFTVEVVVVDNRCTDDTRSVVEEFARSMRVQYLYEDLPGKNKALNRALDDAVLGEIVVFTDDDIDPASDWLDAIWSATRRWPDVSVFGGRIDVVWPEGQTIPEWANRHAVREFGFAAHNLAAEDRPYFDHHLPFGPNYWVRREVLTDRRFDPGVGPSSAGRILGDEIIFLLALQRDGYQPVFVPSARVGHRILPHLLTRSGIQRRAFELGRGIPHLKGWPRRDLLKRSRALWRLSRRLILCRWYASFWTSFLRLGDEARVMRGIEAMRGIGYNVECLRASGPGGRLELDSR